MSCLPVPPIWKPSGGYPGLYPAAGVSAPGILADVYNLWVANNVATPNTKIDIKVGPAASKFEAVLENASAVAAVVSSTSTITINAGTTGANGLDTGTQAASTWYYIYVIYNQATAATAGLLSTSSTAPTLPSGYTYSALVGAVFSGGTTHFQSFNQFNKQVWTPAQNVFTSKAGVTSYTSQSVSTIVPPTAATLSGLFGTSVTNVNSPLALAGDSSGTGEVIAALSVATPTIMDGYNWGVPFSGLPLLTAQAFYWKAAVTSSWFRVDVCGWTYP